MKTDTVPLPGSDCVLIRIKGTKKAIALICDDNSTYHYLNPYEGGKITVAEVAKIVTKQQTLEF